MHNLCGRASHKPVQATLERALDARLKQHGDAFWPGAEYVERFRYQRNREIGGKPGHAVSPWGDWEATLS
jgi:hypothetical protein